MTATEEAHRGRMMAEVFQLFTGQWLPYLVYTTVKLDILEVMPFEKTSSSSMIAEKLKLNPEYTYRLMRSVATAGILEEESKDEFKITEKGKLLRKDGQPSLRDCILLEVSPEHRRSWIHLPTVVKNGPGTTGCMEEYGRGPFEMLESNKEYGQVFNGAMTAYSDMENAMVLKSFDFSPYKTMMDIGGGHGMLLSKIALDNPQMMGYVMDLDHVVKGSTLIKEMGLSDRISLIPGDFFTGLGLKSCDLYLMKHIIHDWSDESCLLILKNILKVSKKSSKLLICDFMVAEPHEASTGAELFDMHMMVMTTGKERTATQMSTLLSEAGWNLLSTIRTPNPQFVIHEATPEIESLNPLYRTNVPTNSEPKP
jgi:predicted transcriptional regulator